MCAVPHDSEFAVAFDELLAGPSLSVVFQPIVDLRRAEPYGYEVLGRCRPLAGPLAAAARSPADLLALAGGHGRLLRLDRRWRELAFEIIAGEADDGGLFFFNVDPRVLDDPGYAPGFTLALAARHGLSADRFVLELTEVASRDPEAVERVLAHYAGQGFRVALDDLGAGQQSLVTLLRVAPAIVKLDRDLVRSVDVDPAREHLLRALVEFADRTGILLIAEGIETVGVLRAVMNVGVRFGQGFLLGRPAPRPSPLAREVQALLHRERGGSHAPGPRRRPAAHDPGKPLLELVEALRTASGRHAAMDHLLACVSALIEADRVSVHFEPGSRTRSTDRGGALEAALCDRVEERSAPLRIDRLDADSRFTLPGQAEPSFISFIGVPLLDVQGPLGVLAAFSAVPAAFSATDERWLQIVAGIVAPHVRAARECWRRRRASAPDLRPGRPRSSPEAAEELGDLSTLAGRGGPRHACS